MAVKGKDPVRRRTTAFVVFVLLVFSVFAADLFRVQVVSPEEYASAKVALKSSTTTVRAARGEILDRNGAPFVTNRQLRSVVFYAPCFPSTAEQEQRNEIICSLIRLFEQNGVPWNDGLPLEFGSDGEIRFRADMKPDIDFLKSRAVLFLNSYATAQNCMDGLVEKFKLQTYSREDARKIASVCFALKKISFSASNPYTFAGDVPTELAAKIKENGAFYRGVDIAVTTEREYADGTLAPHIIGITGKLSEREYGEKKKAYEEASRDENLTQEQRDELALRAYALDDTIGKFGIEGAMEDRLRGTNGVMTTTTDSAGVVSTELTTPPRDGDTVVLTIDAELQKNVQDALAAFVREHRAESGLPAAGSAVVLDVHSGEVLACATYPSYDLSAYYEQFAALNADKGAPLWNRALQSAYAPGSALKPAIAVAALEEGVITEKTKINCTRAYSRFPNMRCLQSGHSGYVDVKSAIWHSCNIFFYETGWRLGIDRMNDYCARFGLGQKTGVEVAESSGVLAGIAYRETHGGTWYPGDTCQAAIGQSDNLFTPIQLCSYAATLANGGTRYQAHFVRSVKTSDYSRTVMENKGTVLGRLGVSQKNLNAAKEGMLLRGEHFAAFHGFPFKIAAKTGTAQVRVKTGGKVIESTNGFMITFAPCNDPQIAVCIAIENLDSGSATAALAAEVYRAYFKAGGGINRAQSCNALLG